MIMTSFLLNTIAFQSVCIKFFKTSLIFSNFSLSKLTHSSVLSIVPQLSRCLKFEVVWGVLTDQMI